MRSTAAGRTSRFPPARAVASFTRGGLDKAVASPSAP